MNGGSAGLKSEGGVIRTLRRGAVEALVLQGLGAGMVFLMHSVLARRIGTEGYGILSYALSLVAMLTVVAATGWPSAVLRLMAEYAGSGSWGLLRGALRRAQQSTLVVALGVALLLLALARWGTSAADLRESLRYAAALLPAIATLALRRRAFQGLHRIKTSIVFEDLGLPALVTAGLLAFGVTTVGGAFAGYLAVAVAIAVAASLWMRRCLPPPARAAAPAYRTREWFAIALPLFFGAVGTIVMNRSDAVVLGTLAGMGEVGVYSAASRIATLNVFVLASINTIAAPMLAKAWHGGRREEFGVIRRQAMGLSTLAATPLCAIMLLWPEPLLALFGPGFAAGAPLLRVLAVGQFVNAATGPVGFALIMSGRERVFGATTATTAAAGVIAYLVVIPRAGALGAAWVSALCIALLNVWQYCLARRLTR